MSNKTKYWCIVFLTMLLTSHLHLRAQSVKYNYDPAGNRTSRTVVSTASGTTTPPALPPTAEDNNSFREIIVEAAAEFMPDSTRYVKKMIDGETVNQYQPYEIEQLSEGVDGSVHHTTFFLPEPVDENQIVPFSIAPASFAEVPGSVEIDRTKAVGSIPITSDVSKGAVSHTIPFDVYPGRHGFNPSLSLVYNSMSGNGVAGYGWHIGGLSAIRPVHSNFYYDGAAAQAEKRGVDATYALDGMRLIRLSAGSYRTEQGHINATIQDQESKYFFNVTFPDGRKATYGYIESTTAQPSYPLTSVTDRAGNFINYTYARRNNNFFVTEVNYGCNGNIIGTIKFSYKARTDDVPVYLAGATLKQDRLLYMIRVYTGATLLRTYTLEHTENIYNFLSQVKCKAGSKELNPLSFYYGTGRTSASLFESTSFLESYFSSMHNKIIHQKYKPNNLVVQDGLIAYPEFNTYGLLETNKKKDQKFGSLYSPTQTLLVYSNLNGYLTTPSRLTTGEGFQGLFPADVNGDGKDELIKLNYHYRNLGSRLEITTYGQSLSGTTRHLDLMYHFRDGGSYSPAPRIFLTGNFMGDGRTMLVAVSSNISPTTHHAPNGVSASTWVTLIDLQNNSILSNGVDFSYDYFKDMLFTMDFDGDGRTELCLVNSAGLHIYTYINRSFTKLVTYSGIKNSDFRPRARKLLLGDINGDGKTDIIISPRQSPYTTRWTEEHVGMCEGCCSGYPYWSNNNERYYECLHDTGNENEVWTLSCLIRETAHRDYESDAFNWKFYVSTGKGFVASTERLPFTFEDNNTFLLYDINNDRFPDMVVKNKRRIEVYLNNNGTISTTSAASRSVDYAASLIPAVAGDSWSDNNRMVQLLAIKDATVSSITFSRDDGIERKLTSVVNSHGVINKIHYSPMSESGVYSPGVSSAYPYNTMFTTEPLVSRLEVYHNNNQLNDILFSYENAVFQRQGRGFCGFRKITQTHRIRGTHTVSHYDPQYDGMMTATETPVDKVTYTWSRSVDSQKFLQLRMTSKTERDKLNNYTVIRSYAHDTYGNVTNETSRYGTAEEVTITNVYNNSPVIGELKDQTVKSVRGDSEWIERTQVTSFHSTTRQPLKVVHTVNGNQVKEVTNTYSEGNLTKVVEKPFASTKTFTTSFQYDDHGRVTKETNPLLLATTYSYNSKGELANTENHRNKRISYAYDEFGRPVKTTHPDGVIETTAFSWVTAPAGAAYLITTTATGKPTGRVYYDVFNREVRKGAAGFDGTYSYTDSQYDIHGRLWKQSQSFRGASSTAWTTYTYDTYDRPLKVQTPSGSVTTWAYTTGKVTTIANGISRTETFDAAGKLLTVADPAGTVTYGTRADGQLAYVIAPGNVRTDFTYDAYGRKTRQADPSFGVVNYTYNTDGLLHKEIDANNKTTEYLYDRYLRKITQKVPEFITTYTYDSEGLLIKDTTTNKTSTIYVYDDHLRMKSIRQHVPDGNWLQKELTYSNGNVSSVKYTSQSGLIATENMVYSNGRLTERKLNNSASFFRMTAKNDLGQTTTAVTGGVTRTYGYNSSGTMTARSAKNSSTTFQNFSYTVNAAKGNLTSRKDNKHNKTESFEYDNLNRLKKYGANTVTFDIKGNILTKSDAGTLAYDTSGKPYAVSGAENITSGIPRRSQSVTYTSFRRPAKITENNNTATFHYNKNFDRVNMQLANSSGNVMSRYYIGNCYEIDKTGTSNVKEKLYLGGDYYSAPAVYVRENGGTWQLYNICRDHLGSITHITNSSGSAVTQELSYDAWGRLRNPSTLANYAPGSEPALFLGRGYTGHEHLPQFGLVNMNARLYDPVLGRFLAADPHIQSPGNSQNHNRYTYGMNNPLMYVDPTGEVMWYIPILIGAAVGAYAGASIQSGTAAFWNWTSNSWQGAIAGAFIGATLGGFASAAMGAEGIVTGINTPLYQTNKLNVVTNSWGITSSALNSATINIGLNAISGGGWDGAWKAGLVGAASGAWNATGGLGLVKPVGEVHSLGHLGRKLGYQMIGTAGSSIGNNWTRGDNPFSGVTVGVGPVNLTFGKGKRLLQWQNNLGNIATHAIGVLGTLATGGDIGFEWENLSVNFEGGLVDKLFPGTGGYGAHAVFLCKSPAAILYPHELHHLWQSRAFGDMFLINYLLQGLSAEILRGFWNDRLNYFEDQAEGNYWW